MRRHAREPTADPELGPAAVMERREAADEIRRAVDSLGSREAEIIKRRFGLDGRRETPAAELARELGVRAATVRRTERRALAALADGTPAVALYLDLLRLARRGLRIGGHSIGDRVMVWNARTSSPLGFGTIVDFRRVWPRDPRLYPEIRLASGATVHGSHFELIPERRALRASERLWGDLFGE